MMDMERVETNDKGEALVGAVLSSSSSPHLSHLFAVQTLQIENQVSSTFPADRGHEAGGDEGEGGTGEAVLSSGKLFDFRAISSFLTMWQCQLQIMDTDRVEMNEKGEPLEAVLSSCKRHPNLVATIAWCSPTFHQVPILIVTCYGLLCS